MGTIPKVVIDTNIAVSALTKGGSPQEILDLAYLGLVEAFFSEEIVEEYSTVLKREKFKQVIATVEEVDGFVEDIRNGEYGQMAIPKVRTSIIADDPKDNMFLDCAIEAQVDYIVSGDKHLLKLGNYRNISIVRARKFLEILKGKR